MPVPALNTDAVHRFLAWPDYRSDEALEHLLTNFGQILADNKDSVLCLRHDETSDPDLETSIARLEAALQRSLASNTIFDLLIVNDEIDDLGWKLLGRNMSATLGDGGCLQGPRKAALQSLDVPAIEDSAGLVDWFTRMHDRRTRYQQFSRL